MPNKRSLEAHTKVNIQIQKILSDIFDRKGFHLHKKLILAQLLTLLKKFLNEFMSDIYRMLLKIYLQNYELWLH